MQIAQQYKAQGADVAGHYGVAQNPQGKLEQTLYTRKNGIVTLFWTGKTYRSMAMAMADSLALNCRA